MKPEVISSVRDARLPGLDLIRAVAIAWVMIDHAAGFELMPDPHRWYFQFGWIGVDLFFGLSGYLIAGQILKPWSIGLRPDYRKFFQRRLLRTLPAYYVVLAIYFLFPDLREFPNIQPFWQFATFTENLFFRISPKAFSHAWSLCVEEQFYLVFPIIVAFIAKRPTPGRIIATFIAIVAGGMAVRGLIWLTVVGDGPFGDITTLDKQAYLNFIYYPTWSRLDGLLMGVAAATIKTFRPTVWTRIVAHPNWLLSLGLVGLAGSMLLFGDLITTFLPAVIGYPLLASSVAAIVIAGSQPRGIIGSRSVPGARALATGAYSLYLTQKLAYHLVDYDYIPGVPQAGWIRFFTALGIALLMGALLYWLVERPFLGLRERWDGPSRSMVAVAS